MCDLRQLIVTILTRSCAASHVLQAQRKQAAAKKQTAVPEDVPRALERFYKK